MKIGVGEADGFIDPVLGGLQLESHFDLGLGYSLAGLRFNGSSWLEIQLPAHASAGPVEIKEVALSIGIKGSTFPVGITADMKAALGPLTAVIQRIGFELAVTLKSDNHGQPRPARRRARLQAADRLGLSIDGGGFKGGGFLIRPEKGEYAGALELEFQGIITVKARRRSSTRSCPDGQRGFSLLIIITAEFPPIQLGFGFTLIGVGGLLGLNRTVDSRRAARGRARRLARQRPLPARRRRQRAAHHHRPQARLPAAAEDRFLIGPMAQARLGHADAHQPRARPDPRDPAAGVRHHRRAARRRCRPRTCRSSTSRSISSASSTSSAGQLSFDASLFDSRLLTFTLTGDMAVRLYWGTTPTSC